MMKNGGGQWDWIGLKYEGDLTGYTKMVAEIIGPAGAKFTFKVNDKVEKPADGTGELVHVEFDLPTDFTWDAAKQTMIMFPDFAAPGVGNEFTITKLELQGEGKTAIDLLTTKITVSNEYVQACRDLVLTKPTTNTNAWDCVIISLPGDYAKYQGVQYTVKGTAGEKLLVKVNDQFESWVTLDGKAQTGLAPLSGEFNASKAAVVLFPNGETAGTGNPIVVSQLVFVPPLTEHAGTAADPYTVEDALKLGATLAESGYGKNGEVVEMWVKGFVVDQGRDVGTSSNNIKLASTANGQTTLLIFKVDETADIKDVRLGDEVVIKGFLMNWSGTIEVSSSKVDGSDVNPVFVSCTRGTNAITVASDSSDKATVTDLSAQSGLNGSTFTFKVEVTSGFQISAVKVNGEKVEAADGVYSGIVSGPTSISVETVEAGAAVPQEATLEYKDSTTTTNMGEGNNATIVNLNAELFNVAADKGTNNNFPGLNKALDVRVYKGNSMTIAIASGYTIKSIKINFLSGYAANAVIEVNGVAVTGEAGVYAINASSFVLKHSEASNDQVRFSSIVITYVEGDAPQPAPVLSSVKYDGAKQGTFEKQQDGTYLARVELGAWNRISFALVYSDASEIVLWYDNTTFTGLIQDEATTGDQWDGKLYHEADDGKRWMPGQASGYTFRYNPETHTMAVSTYIPGGELRYGGAKEGKFVKNESGLYVATLELGAWNRVSFALIDEDGNATDLWYDNTTFTGLIQDEATTGDQWDGKLYHEADDGKRWMPGQAAGYKFTYNPETHTMNVSQYIPGGELRYGGEKEGTFTKGEDNLLTATVSLTQWKRISFALVDEDGNATALWYDNTTFTGKITAADKEGDQWDGSLYHESGDGQRWMPGEGPERTYRFTYNPETRTMNVELLDVTAPVITISDAVMQALAAKEFWEGANEQATFAAFMQGISANDDTDGAITVTQEMINLGGLNPANLVGGDYTITITVKDAAGNEAKKEVKIHVKKYANENLFADHPGSDTAYNSTKWTRENYKNDQWNVISGQMNARTKDGVKVVNMVNGYSVPMRFTYNKDGAALGVANKLTFKVGNYYTGATAMSVKVKLVLVNGTEVFIAGDANNWATIPVTQGLIDQELTFDTAEVKSVVFVTRSTNNGSTYLYVGNCVLGYEEPSSSPAAFQLTNLNVAAPEFTSNHIEGAGVHMWVDPASIGLTMENWGTVTKEVSATAEGYTIGEHFLSDPSANAVRCFVTLDHAPAADEIITLNVTITIDGHAYQAAVAFQNGALAQ